MSFPKHFPSSWVKLLESESRFLSREYADDPMADDSPHDIPHEQDVLNIEIEGRVYPYLSTSTRIVGIGHEVSGDWGFICAIDGRGKTQYVLGGGTVIPNYKASDAGEYPKALERTRDCARREYREELDITLLGCTVLHPFVVVINRYS